MTKIANSRAVGRTRKHLVGVLHCPVTRGHVTVMTEEGFVKKCTESQLAAEDFVYAHRCKTCQGKQRPMELEIRSLGELIEMRKQEGKMGTESKEIGVCANCQQAGRKLKKHYDELVCSSCEILRIACRNRPEVVRKTLTAMASGSCVEYLAPGEVPAAAHQGNS